MKILYFAWLRERLNRSEEIVNPPADVATISDLIDWLAKSDEVAAHVFAKRALIRAAIDSKIVGHDALIADAQTIALFPPMTGG